jgi:hypothetical protein
VCVDISYIIECIFILSITVPTRETIIIPSPEGTERLKINLQQDTIILDMSNTIAQNI